MNNSSACPRVCSSETNLVSWLWYTVLSWQDPDETQPNTVAQGRESVLCQRDDGCALVDSWCE